MPDTRSRLATSRAPWLPSETGPTLADLEPGAVPATPSGLLRGIVASHPSAVETRAHIFEPFFTTKGLGKGTGLGLATTYGTVRQSGGHIWLYSEPGEGTTFKAYFPLVGEDLTATAVAPPQAAGGSETILLVEDEPAVRELTRLILERRGYDLLVAADPIEALAMVEGHPAPIHLLVSDVVMPMLSGPELARRLRELRPEIRTLFLSGYTEELVGSKGGLRAGDGFLSKPFTPDALARNVRELIDESQART